jgi:putative ABC transport system substrate-binding protein
VRRREFITLLGGAAAAWPLGAWAQQPAMPVVGFVYSQSPEVVADRLRGFRRGLREAGFVEGENLTVEYRWAEGQFDRTAELIADLVRRRVAVIAALNNHSALAATSATKTIPIVFNVNEDPVAMGLVASIARPGGNATGANYVSGELAAKRLQLLRELVPAARRVAVLVNPTNPTIAQTTLRDVEPAARDLGLETQNLNAATVPEIGAVFATFERSRPDALFVGADGFFTARRVQLTQLAAFHRMPATFGTRESAEAGGLMSYGSNVVDAWRQVGVYVGRILKGTKPADLPVVQANKFELVVNVETARMLGLTVPATLLASADEVIE